MAWVVIFQCWIIRWYCEWNQQRCRDSYNKYNFSTCFIRPVDIKFKKVDHWRKEKFKTRFLGFDEWNSRGSCHHNCWMRLGRTMGRCGDGINWFYNILLSMLSDEQNEDWWPSRGFLSPWGLWNNGLHSFSFFLNWKRNHLRWINWNIDYRWKREYNCRWRWSFKNLVIRMLSNCFMVWRIERGIFRYCSQIRVSETVRVRWNFRWRPILLWPNRVFWRA